MAEDQVASQDDENEVKFFNYPTQSELMPLRTSGPAPQLARLIEIDLAIGSGSTRSIELTYTRSLDFAVSNEIDFLAKMSALVVERKHHGSRARERDRDSNGNPLGTKMSIRGANFGLRYLVIRLSRGIDWAFFDPKGQKLPPFTMAKSEISRNMFFQGGKFKPDGTHVAADSDEPQCQYAYFIVDGAGLGGQYFPPRRFNIHVDLLERDKDDNIINRIPIIIDPDVRNPGGGGG